MAVVIETTLGDFTVDLFTEKRPRTCLNFLKLCKIKYYNLCLFHSVQHNFLAQTGDPTGTGKNGESVFGKIHGDEARFYEAESVPKLRHTKPGLLSMVNCGNNMLGSQFFITLGSELQSLDNEHCVFGEVAEGNEVLLKLNETICDSEHRPYQDIRITHTIILDDPFDDPQGLQVPDCSPEPSPEALMNGRIAPDEELDETRGLSAAEIEERARSREACAQATILEIVGDLPDADMAPPENVLFVCKLNPVTNDDDLEIIFSRFGKVKSCEVIRDKITGDSLQYAFVEFEDRKACEDAYFKMDNVLIDDRRIHVDFSQSVARLRWKGKGRGVEHIPEKAETKQDTSGGKHVKSQREFRGPVDHVKSREMKIHQHNHANDRRSRGREYDRNKNSAYKKDSSYDHYKEIDKKTARNDKDKGEKRSRHSYDRSREVNRKHDEPRSNNEEDKRRREVDKDAKSSHSNEESKKYRDTGKDVKLKQEPRNRHNEEDKRCRDKDKGLKIKHSNEEGKSNRDNRHISEEGKVCRETDKVARNEEEKGCKNVDKDIIVKNVGSRTRQSSEEDKRLPREMKEGVKKCKNVKEEHREIMEKTGKKVRGESMTKEKRKKRQSSSLVQSRKKQKRSASSDSESSSSSDFTSSTDSSSSESSGEQSKARQKKHKRPTVLARKSKKKVRLSKKGRCKWRKDLDTDSSSSFDSSDSGSRGKTRRNKKKRRRKDASSEEDSSSEHEGKRKKKRDKKKKKKKRKVTTKRKRKTSSSEDSDTDDTTDTSSDSEDEKPSRKRRKKVIRKNKKNHTVKRKSVRRSESDELSSGDKKKKHRKVGSSASD